MKIVHYTASLNRSAGGVPYAAAGLALAQQKLGADVEVHGGVDGFDDDDRLIWRDMRLITTAMPNGSYGLSRKAISKVFAARPDIVHIHGIWCATSIVGRLVASRGIPTIVAPHGMLDPWILQRSKAKKAVHSLLFEKPLLKRGGVHALNKAEADAVRAFMPGQELTIFTLPNGVELPQLDANRKRDGVLFLGRMHEKKQVAELIQNWVAEPSLNDTMLRIAGGGTPAYCQKIEELAKAARNVEYLGAVYGAAKDELLARSAWFILPSQSEGLPMAVLEAIGAGCVPIITPECNLGTLVDQGCAFHMRMDFSDFPVISKMLATMAADETEYFSRRAKKVANSFAWPSVAAQMLRSYEQLASSQHNG
jgi:poly(glycerol-phosphate) alpha-glucosyltransferase